LLIKLLYRLRHYFWAIICIGLSIVNIKAQSLFEDWNEVQSFYQNAPALEVRILMLTSVDNQQTEKQVLSLTKYGDRYYYDLGDMELSINQKSMLLINHRQRIIIRQPLPHYHTFGHQVISSDSLFKTFKNAIQYLGLNQGKRHYRIRPGSSNILTQADYYFTGTGTGTRFHHAVIQYKQQGKLFQTTFQITTSTALKDKRKFKQNYFLTTKNQQWVGIGKYINYRVADQQYEK